MKKTDKGINKNLDDAQKSVNSSRLMNTQRFNLQLKM